MDQLRGLRARCDRYANSFFTPMGDEMFYRYQQFMIDEATTTLGALLHGAPDVAAPGTKPGDAIQPGA
jgi:hypothetical protein